MKKILSLITFLVLSQATSYAQKDEISPEILGNNYATKGIELFYSNSIDSAIYYTSKANEIYKKEELWAHYICSLNNLSSFYYQDKRHGLALKEIIFASYNLSKTHLKPYNECYISAVSNISQHFFSIGDHSKAIAIQKEALELNIEHKKSKLSIATMYSNLSTYYKYSGDYQNAHNYLRKALQVQLDSVPSSPIIAETYHDIGRVFRLEGLVDSAIFYLNKEEQILSSIRQGESIYLERKIDNFLNLADLWSEKNNWQKVDTYVNKTSQFSLNEYYQILKHEKLAKIEIAKLNYSEAIQELEKGELIAEEFDKRNNPSMKSRRLIDLASAYYSSTNYNNAISNYQKILILLSPHFENTDFKSNPKANQLFAKPSALTALNGKAKALQKIYAQNQDTAYLNASYQTYLTATQLIRNMRQGFLNHDAKNTLAENSVTIYEGAIQTALKLHQITKKGNYKSKSFELAESNKALLLLEDINDQSAKKFSSIPDSLLKKEKELKLNLAYLQKQSLEKKSSKNIQNDIFELKQQLDQLTNNFEKNYPRFFELKHKNDPVGLANIQQQLDNSALLEFFVGDETIYLFIVTENEIDIITIDNTEAVDNNIKQLRTALSTAPGSLDAQTEFNNFTNPAHQLYNLLLKSAIDQLPNDINYLTIIPDYQLNYIPFDILLTEPSNPEQPSYSSASLEYVMKKYSVNYHYSATLLHKNLRRNAPDYKHTFVGYAPSFQSGRNIASRTCTSDELYSLSCSNEEVQSISKLLNGTIHTGIDANKKVFESVAGTSRILHLATHACVDKTDTSVNKIFLTDDFLTNHDLYNMSLNAELAVLSACNTGSGKLIKGEGVMSLARGFINAGCSSTLMSMWSVDDCATSEIMILFYEGLKKGLTKDEALRSAKTTYLRTASKSKAHPYYWAAFVQFGDTSAMKLGRSFNYLYLLLGLGLLLILGRLILKMW